MRIIITGGSGLLGRELTTQLSAAGHEVIILSRTPHKVNRLPENARAEKWDAHTAAGWGHLADGAEAIINFAGANIGEKRWTEERKKEILQSRVQAGQAVVAAVQAATTKPKVVIQASAIGYYGDRGDEPLPETAAAGDNFLAHVCLAWEQAIKPIAAQVRLVIIRSGVVLTTEDGALKQLMLPFKLFAGGPLGSGKQWFPWIHIDDEIAAILYLLKNREGEGVYNLTSPRIMTNANFAKTLGKVMGRPAVMPTPAFAIRLALGEMASLVLDSQRVIPTRLQASDFTFQYPDAENALNDIIKHNK